MHTYPKSATPVSKISVVNFRMPSTQSSTSETAFVMTFPAPSFSSSTRDLCTSVRYRIRFIRRFTLLAKLAPSEVLEVTLLDEGKSCRVIVPDNQLSLAIGKEGQNARLAAKLTGYKIDIKPESEA